MTTQTAFDLLRIAQSYVAAGLSIIPIKPGTKKPDPGLLPQDSNFKRTWKPYQERHATEHELHTWCAANCGIGIVAGAISGGLVVLDIESATAYTQWRELADMTVGMMTLARLTIVQTGKGYHVYMRCPHPGGNHKLAMADDNTTLAETRGEGGYVLAPPTIHPNGHPYTLVQGTLELIPMLDQETGDALLDAARSLAAPIAPKTDSKRANGSGSVIDAFNKAFAIEDILQQAGYTQESGNRWVRPGGERSSIIVDQGKSIHFNSNDPLCSPAPGGGYYRQTPFSAWCKLNHNDDVKKAVKAAAQELGLTKQWKSFFLDRVGRVVGLGQSDGDSDTEIDTWPYFTHNGGIWMHDEKHGSQVLTNFDARVTAETVYNDGENEEEYYTITATCGKRQRTITMTRVEFETDGAVAKLTAALGAKARVNPRVQKSYVIDAIKAMSDTIEEKNYYTFTGWTSEKFGARYLVGNGYIDAEGWHESDWCVLPQRLQRLHQYNLEPGHSIADALAVFDHLLETAPVSVTAPVIGGILLAPIRFAIDAAAPMIHVYGITGSHKTAYTCAAMSLWGKFTPARPTDSWTSTSNSIQKLGWHLKDAPMLLDDYKIANVKPKDVTFLLQNYGDQTARGRLDTNATLKNVYPVRSIILSSGEDQPEGEASTLARILSVSLERGAIDRANLSLVQANATTLHALTIDYLTWLATQTLEATIIYEAARTLLLDRIEGTQNATNAGRVASNIAIIHTAWEIFFKFLAEKDYWSQEKITTWRKKCKRALFDLAQKQLRLTTQERYSQIFLDAVQGLLVSGRACLLPDTPLPGQVILGKRDHDGVFLICTSCYDEVVKHLRTTGRTLGASSNAISRMLQQDGVLVNITPPNLRVRKAINGGYPWCWHLPPDIFAIFPEGD